MTTDDRFGTSLSSWLREDAAHRVPDHLAETLMQTAATRQRPWWSSLERLLPMSSTTMGGRVAAPSPILLVLALGLLLAAIVGIAVVADQPGPVIPAPLASNGRIVAVDGTSIVTFAPDGSDRQVVVPNLLSDDVPTLAMSPDGTRVAFRINSPYGIQIARLDDGTLTTIPVESATAIADEYIGWSPDGTELAFGALTGRGEDLMIAAADGSSVRSLRDAIGQAAQTVWQPTYSPDGEWIAFAGNRLAATHLFVIHPDGTGLRELDLGLLSPEAGDGGGPVWSPDKAAHRLAYETFYANALHLRMFDLDTNEDTEIGAGFWPSWSPDGTRISGCCASIWSIEDALAGAATPTIVFAEFPGNCPDAQDWSGRSICSPVVFSPDGQWVVAGDIAGRDLLLTKADGTGGVTRIPATSGVRSGGFKIPLGWQPVWP
jgi:Tol biopolymer transport system component